VFAPLIQSRKIFYPLDYIVKISLIPDPKDPTSIAELALFYGFAD